MPRATQPWIFFSKSQIFGFHLGTLIDSEPDFLTEIPNHKGRYSMQGINLSWKIFNLRMLSLQPTRTGKLLNYLSQKLSSTSSHPTFRIFLESTSIIAVPFPLAHQEAVWRSSSRLMETTRFCPFLEPAVGWLVGWLGVGPFFVGVTTGRNSPQRHWSGRS